MIRTTVSARTIILALAVVGAVNGLKAPQAAAQDGFTVYFSPSATVLDAWYDYNIANTISGAEFMDIQMLMSCDNPNNRVQARNKPAVLLVNDAASTQEISSVTLKINEGDYVFGTGDLPADLFMNYIKNTMYTDPGVSITSSSASADFKTVTVNFTGLTPGKRAVFHLDLDALGNMFIYPDYRGALYGTPLSNFDMPTDPATFTAYYGPLPGATEVAVELNDTYHIAGDGNFDDYPNLAMNGNIRRYHDMDNMEFNGFGGAIPEPNAAVMALAGAAVLAVRRRRLSA